MAVATKKTGGGWNKKTAEEHRRNGTYRPGLHGKIAGAFEPLAHLAAKPQHLPPSRRKAPAKWVRGPADERAVADGCWFDERFGQYVRQFIEKHLRLWQNEWAGQPFILTDVQYEHLVAPLFSWFRMDEERGRPVRRFDRAYIEWPKKNAKSPTAAAIALYLWVADGVPADVFCTAVTKPQAGIVHRHSVRMARASEELEKRIKFSESSYSMTYRPTGTVCRAVATEEGVEGLNGHVVIDELHAWKGRTNFDRVRYMTASLAEPLIFVITTAGDDLHGICREYHDYAEAVQRGAIVDEGFFGSIWAAGEDDDLGDPKTWRKANPHLGVTVFEREMKSAYEEAKASTAKLNAFRRYRLNHWVSTDAQWLDVDKWAACAGELGDFSGQVFAGMDLSRTRDLTSFVLAEDVDGVTHLRPYFWIAEAWLNELDKVFPKMREWAAAGLVRSSPGEIIDYSLVFEELDEIVDGLNVAQLRHDRRFASDVVSRFCDRHNIAAVDFPQTETHYTAPMLEFESRMVTGRLRHDGNQLMGWQIGNAIIKQGTRGTILQKRQAGDHRTIDGVVAAVMALSGTMVYDASDYFTAAII